MKAAVNRVWLCLSSQVESLFLLGARRLSSDDKLASGGSDTYFVSSGESLLRQDLFLLSVVLNVSPQKTQTVILFFFGVLGPDDIMIILYSHLSAHGIPVN